MIISGLQKLTLLDFPGYIACTLFTQGCNLRCPFCHNKNLVMAECFKNNQQIPEEQIIEFLKIRKTRLQGVCITGGEPTIQNGLIEFIQNIHDMGYRIKLDTNGTNPNIIQNIISKNLIDYIAMDIKNSLSEYTVASGTNADTEKILESVNIIKNAGIDYEFRTTVVKEIHTEKTFRSIAQTIGHVKMYSLQYYEETGGVINPIYHTPSDEDMTAYSRIMQTVSDHVVIKGR